VFLHEIFQVIGIQVKEFLVIGNLMIVQLNAAQLIQLMMLLLVTQQIDCLVIVVESVVVKII
jgi:hypothetical protein